MIKQIQQKAKDGTLKDLMNEFQTNLDLTFESNPTPNLCLKDAEEVRDEYKTTFSLQDLTHYLSAIGINKINFKIEKTPIPKDAGTFWELVRRGKSKNMED
ncbi:hypothetical protein [Aquiflexum lacus]|uniref:hypothetical protein n=1 Tax=Aquiflexum lacus TaxID=2483805 RepID=UPI001893DD82|nr:hypothetical protein [Aquiflexum lacus]